MGRKTYETVEQSKNQQDSQQVSKCPPQIGREDVGANRAVFNRKYTSDKISEINAVFFLGIDKKNILRAQNFEGLARFI